MGDERDKIKIIELSHNNCEPCKALQNLVEIELSKEYDIDFVVVDRDKLSSEEIEKIFGKATVVPTIIIESSHRTKRIEGYSEESLRKAIEDVLEGE